MTTTRNVTNQEEEGSRSCNLPMTTTNDTLTWSLWRQALEQFQWQRIKAYSRSVVNVRTVEERNQSIPNVMYEVVKTPLYLLVVL